MQEMTIALLGIALICSYISSYKQSKEFLEYRKQQGESGNNNTYRSPIYRNIFLSGFGCCAGFGVAIIGIISAIR